MNKGKQLVVALLVFGALVGAALLVWRDPFERTSRVDYSGLLPPRPEGSIEQITMTTKDGSITAEKRGDTWWITAPRELAADDGQLKAAAASGDTWGKTGDPAWQADMARFGQVLDALSRLSWVEIVDDPPSVTDYGFTAPPARVTATAAGKDHVLVFGKDAEGTTGNCWAKIEGDPKVYQVRKAFLDRFTRDCDYYRGEPPKPEAEEPKKTN